MFTEEICNFLAEKKYSILAPATLDGGVTIEANNNQYDYENGKAYFLIFTADDSSCGAFVTFDNLKQISSILNSIDDNLENWVIDGIDHSYIEKPFKKLTEYLKLKK